LKDKKKKKKSDGYVPVLAVSCTCVTNSINTKAAGIITGKAGMPLIPAIGRESPKMIQ
jgi:hypothetical protein